MRVFLVFAFLLYAWVPGWGQGSLQFNQVRTITNAPETVPAGKVWKVTSVFGEEPRYNLCLSISASANHEIDRMRCGYTSNSWQTVRVPYYTISKIIVNGKTIPVRINGLRDGDYENFIGANCDVQQTNRVANWSCGNITSDPNLFPLWLGEGSTLETGGPNTLVSLVEFNVLP